MIKKILQFLLSIFFGLLFRLEKKEKSSSNFVQVSKLYAKGGFGELFAKIRIWDTPLELLEKMVPKNGLIADLGCGDGLVTNYLALKASTRQIIGIDKNLSRIELADKGLDNTKFVEGDVLKQLLPPSDVILMVHLLHHLPSFKDQETVLRECQNKIKKGGELVIVEIDRKPFLKYLLTWIVDILIFPILFEGKIVSPKIYYRTGEQWRGFLEKIGFDVQVIEAHRGKPFSHIILVGKKC